jgi:hypothetical protein
MVQMLGLERCSALDLPGSGRNNRRPLAPS